MNKYLPAIIFIALSLTWGSSFILMKRGLEIREMEAFSPGQVGALRIVFSFLFMLPWGLKAFKEIPRERLKFIAIVGLVGNFIPAFLFAAAQAPNVGLPSSITGILNGLTPLFTFIIGLFIFKTASKTGQLIGLVIAFFGTIGLSFVGKKGGLDNMNLYALLVVLATICYAISTNLIKVKLTGLKAIQITAVAMIIIGPLAIVYLSFTDFTERLSSKPHAWEALGYVAVLGVFGTAIALIFFNKLIHMTSAVFASSVTYLIPIVAVGWGLWDGEQIYPLHYLGMGLIISGIYLVNKWK